MCASLVHFPWRVAELEHLVQMELAYVTRRFLSSPSSLTVATAGPLHSPEPWTRFGPPENSRPCCGRLQLSACLWALSPLRGQWEYLFLGPSSILDPPTLQIALAGLSSPSTLVHFSDEHVACIWKADRPGTCSLEPTTLLTLLGSAPFLERSKASETPNSWSRVVERWSRAPLVLTTLRAQSSPQLQATPDRQSCGHRRAKWSEERTEWLPF